MICCTCCRRNPSKRETRVWQWLAWEFISLLGYNVICIALIKHHE
jgi:hypothetical protein